jgi:hypothetical protein
MPVDLDEYARLGIPPPLPVPDQSLQDIAESGVDSITVDKPPADEWRPSRRASKNASKNASKTARPRARASMGRRIKNRMILAAMLLGLLGAWIWLPHDGSELAGLASAESAEASQGTIVSAEAPLAVPTAPAHAGLPSWLSREILFATPVVRAATTPAADAATRIPPR